MAKKTLKTSSISQTSRLGNWLPWEPAFLNLWLKKTIRAAKKTNAPFHPVMVEFQQMIETDPVMNMYFTQMFQQQPSFPPPVGSGDVKIKNYQEMLVVINHLLGTAPEFNTTGMVGFPINAILDFPMITPAGLAAFVSPKVNAMFKKVLAVWTKFLDSPESRYILNTTKGGWFSPAALKAWNADAFQLDKQKPYWGFASWNDFFIRQFKPGLRPVASPDDAKIVVSACEAAPFSIQKNVKKTDTFWIKGQPYSLEHMLMGHHTDYYVGGTVYQAFLSAENYHRWHSPIDGTIKEFHLVGGSYYAEAASVGFDPAGPNNSQGYIAHVAARALIFIESKDPVLGMVCVIPIGMAEVSSCVITVKKGQKVKKGEQIGYFQFGGSTHCVVFKKNAIAEFAKGAQPQGEFGANSVILPINSKLAVVNK
jgi:phosphatidylserine decarboxylase